MRDSRRGLRYILRNYWQLYVLLIVPVVYILIFHYYPITGMQLAFKKFDYALGMWGSPWNGLDNFRKFFGNYMFSRIIINTVRISVMNVLFTFPFPIMFALALNSVYHTKFKKTAQTLTYIPHFISVVVMVGILRQFLHPRIGVYGGLMYLMTGDYPKDPFIMPQAFDMLYVTSGVWQTFGYGSIMYLAALSGVNPELYEAAEIDGTTRFQRVLHVEFPSILPTIIIMLILRVGTLIGVGFEKVYLMQTAMNLQTSEVISTYIYKQSIGGGVLANYGYATAVSLFNNVINFILLVSVNAISRRVSETSLW